MPFSEDQLTRDKFLDGRLLIYQPKTGYRAATDPVLLAASCPAKQGETVLELGCGVGTAALCLGARVAVSLSGLELQNDYAELAMRNAKENGIPMNVICGDLLKMPPELKEQPFDHVIMNPPYYGPGATSPDAGRAAARQAQVSLGEWIDAGLKRVRPRGWLTLIQTIEWLPEVIVALNGRAGGIEIRPLSPRDGKPAARFILRARKGSRSKTLLANPLILHAGAIHKADTDDFSEEARSVLRDGAALKF